MTINRNQHDKTEREPVSRQNFKDAMRQILATEEHKRPRSENREPSKDELRKRWKLERRNRELAF